MSNDEDTQLKKDQQSYDSITSKDNISNTNDNNISQNIKLSSEEENNTNSILKDVIYNRFIQFKDWISKKILQLSQKITIESSYKTCLIFLIAGIIIIIMSLFNLPFILLKPVQFLFLFNLGNILIFISLLFYYGSTQYFQTLIEKRTIMILYVLSLIFGTIFSIKQKYFFSLFFSIGQMIIATMFFLTFIPGGQNGIDFIKSLIGIPFHQIIIYIKNIFIKN
jgi:hypothetical protein